ncbi:MAG: hypothetical protein ACXVCE_14635, partial [Bacteriovorax sp.]
MKKSLKNYLCLSLTLTSMLAFKVGDQIELEAYLHARSRADFTKGSKIETTLSKGTRGEVVESKKMPSGNYGIKMKVENGSHKGESYWVYYNLRAPMMKLMDAKNQELKKQAIAQGNNQEIEPSKEQELGPSSDQEIEQAKKAELTADQTGYRAPEEKDVVDAVQTATQALDPKSVSQIIPTPKSPDCAPPASPSTISLKTTTAAIPEDQYRETDLVEPYREVATSPLGPTACVSAGFGWDQCKMDATTTGKVDGFKIVNNGPNNIVKTDEYYINREMSFEFDDRARSDMKLLVSDGPDDRTSHITWSVMMFFPRSVLPSIKRVGDELEVTLPNKEIVRYNAKTKEVIGGVFTEGPMRQDPKTKKAVPADI